MKYIPEFFQDGSADAHLDAILLEQGKGLSGRPGFIGDCLDQDVAVEHDARSVGGMIHLRDFRRD
jgi:hypothetical protein